MLGDLAGRVSRVRADLVRDDLWERVAPLLPPAPERRRRYPGRLRVPGRAALAGVMYVLRTGVAWRDVPAETVGCSGVTAWRRLRDWTEAGVWPRLHAALLAELRRADLLDLDDCSVIACPGSQGGDHVGPSPVDRRVITIGPRRVCPTTTPPERVQAHGRRLAAGVLLLLALASALGCHPTVLTVLPAWRSSERARRMKGLPTTAQATRLSGDPEPDIPSVATGGSGNSGDRRCADGSRTRGPPCCSTPSCTNRPTR